MLIILLFVLLLNLVAIALIYNMLSKLEKKEKLIFVAVSISFIYMITSIVYWISTKSIENSEILENVKNIIMFLFVPINSIIVLPIVAKSYIGYKFKKIDSEKFRNRLIFLIIPFIIILIIECSYFSDIQNEILNVMKNSIENTTINEEDDKNITEKTEINNYIINDIIKDDKIENIK